MAEVEAGEQGHVADDQPQRGVGDVQAGEPEVDHVAEFAAIVLTGFVCWRREQVPDLRVLDSYCPPKIEGPEKGAAGGTESTDCRPGTARQDEVFQACRER